MAESSNSSANSSANAGSQNAAATSSATSQNAATGSQSVSLGNAAATNSSNSSGNDGGFSSGFSGLSFSNGQFSVNSNGNFSGGLPGFGGFSNTNEAFSNVTYQNNQTEPTMTVDEVYGKSNQARVESQGDYAALSNEKSNVETSTFGKQDAISVTPLSVTENKAEADNAAVQSIEGLTFEQKDKQSQDVLDSRKSRDEAEAEDKSNQMRNQIRALNENKVTDEDADSFFKIGESRQEKAFNEEDGKRSTELKQQEQQLNIVNQEVAKQRTNVENAETALTEAQAEAEAADKQMVQANTRLSNIQQALIDADKYNDSRAYEKATNELYSIAEEFGVDYDALRGDAEKTVDGPKMLANEILSISYQRLSEAIDKVTAAKESLTQCKNSYEDISKQQKNLQAQYNKNKKGYDSWRTDAWAKVTNSPDYSFDNTISEIAKSTDPLAPEAAQALTDVQTSRSEIQDAASKLTSNLENANDADIATFINACTQYNKNVKAALKGNRFANTDFNETFTRGVADANNFTVTLADGSTMNFSEFATEMATKSPQIAAAMYNAKADSLETDGHPVLAKINRALAGAMDSWFGSKLGFADNQVRSQFNQMAKTDARATYAAYNNVLNDPDAKPEVKAEAQAAIAQSNSLMTASTALQASTGFFSGIGDSYSDGVYGKTDPGALNTYQKTLNTISNFARITLGLGITPGANKAYQNMFYMAGDEVNRSLLFNKDFDADGFALCQEYGNSAAANMIVGAGELATSIALMFNPATLQMGINLAIDSVQAFFDGIYGVQKDARKSQQYTEQVLSYFKDAQGIAAKSGNEEAVNTFTGAISQIENFELQSDEVNDLDKWLEGSGSNTADNGKFNQSLSYDEWLRLIEADPTMQDYAKKLIAEKR